MTYEERKQQVKSYLGKVIDIEIDRPIGYVHHKEKYDLVYPINYGYIPGVLGGDDEELDVYLLGVAEKVDRYTCKVIGISHRHNDVEDKLIAAPIGMSFTAEQMKQAIAFQEQYYETHVEGIQILNNPQLIFDIWQILDNPEMFPFFKQTQINDDTLLIQNTLNPNFDMFTYVSDKSVDYSIVEAKSSKDVILSYYSTSSDWKSIDNLPSNAEASLINSSVIYTCASKPCSAGVALQKAVQEDCNALPNNDDDNVHDYTEQIREAVDTNMADVFVIKHNKKPACFVVVTDVKSKMFGLECKCVSAVYTLPQYRKMGYAGKLISAILCQNVDSSFIYVADSINNTPSNCLAKTCGFKIVGYNHQIEIKKCR